MASNLLTPLPTSYRSNDVLSFLPNGDEARAHAWEQPTRLGATPSGLTIASVTGLGTETFPLHYVGLTRDDAREIESFVEDHAGRKAGFWCPTFQHDFATVANALSSGGTVFVREWGYAANIFPLGLGYRHIVAMRGALRFIAPLQGVSDTGDDDVDGVSIYEYQPFGSGTAGDGTTILSGGTATYDAIGLRVSRCWWARFAEDAITTEWTHPNFASITLRVTPIPSESP